VHIASRLEFSPDWFIVMGITSGISADEATNF
jgi:hypothetical protein